MFDKILGALLGAPAEQIASFFKEKMKLKQELKLTKIRGRIAAERAKETRAIQADSNDHEWEILQIKNSGWKDEFVLIVISMPLIMSFIPGLSPYVEDGFAVLDNTPPYYRLLVLVIFFAIYGVRYWKRKD